jgi:hypothetical protein
VVTESGPDLISIGLGRLLIAEAETRGHWLAAEIMRAWTGRRGQPSGQEEGSR